jgi:D-tagatose-1,6-bisphosphate aldolase subunit GatZ/KbaZ
MSNYLSELARSRSGSGQRGIYSVCSAHPWVLEAAMERHQSEPGPLLIEATCNQVNQAGGYTGMTPEDFQNRVHRLAAQCGFSRKRILLGGDHLGPFPWQHLDAATAMENACILVRAFVSAGFTKIHLDASMPCTDDPRELPGQVISDRAARLCAAAEAAAGASRPVYVIGTEVPTPGGAAENLEMQVTSVDAAEEALQTHKDAFSRAGLDAAWERVIALVVQPGVEFGNETVEDYDPVRARELTAVLNRRPSLIFEAHSTDYQTPGSLAALVRDGFATLKVGPGLTYAMRQALYALAAIEEECVPAHQRSRLRERIESAMLAHPEQWQKHYPGTPEMQRRLRIHSYSDRIRYYWTQPDVQRAVAQLVANLSGIEIPETLLNDSLPLQYSRVRAKKISKKPLPLIFDAIGSALAPYIDACEPSGL